MKKLKDNTQVDMSDLDDLLLDFQKSKELDLFIKALTVGEARLLQRKLNNLLRTDQ